ncbi:ATP-binding protein [Streptomyces sp. NBC_00513]|uniref:ATP-binding protein n=1 Tax=unclassified Streptomyces TaxID=2593676 RepID=UPI00224F41D3|nr:ATP-binding protein [Streptomyces sp. NBC_00424]MCX5071204.1 ATP-binding protein [Streptomyces sp. NBC_00424]WUD45380.1 ATP-binding protein [Streptomyces sp. NBC_00513]
MPRITRLTTTAPSFRKVTPCTHRYELPADLKAPRLLRTWITARLAGWHLYEPSDDLLLIASELATNAVRHGGIPARITLALRCPDTGQRVVRLEVEDPGPGFDPRSRTHAVRVESCTGRGLLLVETLSSAWGVRPTVTGQLVWAELHC